MHSVHNVHHSGIKYIHSAVQSSPPPSQAEILYPLNNNSLLPPPPGPDNHYSLSMNNTVMNTTVKLCSYFQFFGIYIQ